MALGSAEKPLYSIEMSALDAPPLHHYDAGTALCPFGGDFPLEKIPDTETS